MPNKQESTTRDVERKAYLKGYKEGFYSALKVVWAEAEEMLINIPNEGKDYVRKFIDKIKQ